MRLLAIKLVQYSLKKNSSIASAMLAVIRLLSFGRWKYKVVRCDWIDRYDGISSGVLRKASNGTSFRPRFYGTNQSNQVIVQHPEVKFRLFDNAGISITSSSVLMNDGSLAIERVGREDSTAIDYSGGHILMHHGNSAVVNEGEPIDIKCGIFFGGNGAFNYYHWLMEIISKSEFLHDLPYQKFPLLVSSDVNEIPSFQEILKKFAKAFDVIVLKKNEVYRVEKLIYIDAPNNLPFNLRTGEKLKASQTLIHKSSIDYIRRICLSSEVIDGGESSVFHKKIFLKRKVERRKYNQDSVESVLKKYGFVNVCMESLSFEEQVRTIFNAKWIAGPTGAAWTNLLFAREGTKALCWMAEELGDFSVFSTIARNVGVDLKYITYQSGIHSTADAYCRNYHIDVNLIEKIVSGDL